MKPYLSYTYSSNTDLKHQYILAGVNKYYKHNIIQYYVGVLGGYGQLKWKYDPLNSSAKRDYEATSFIVGLQGGLDYPINDKFSLGLNAKYLFTDYETNLKTTNASSSIEYNKTTSISVGLSYSF